MSGGGRGKLGPCWKVSTYGFKRELLNTGCIFIVVGSSNLQLVGVAQRTLKGPYRFGANLAFGWVVWRFVASSHTKSSLQNSWDASVGFPFRISVAANSKAAETSLRICSRYCTRSSTLCIRVCR